MIGLFYRGLSENRAQLTLLLLLWKIKFGLKIQPNARGDYWILYHKINKKSSIVLCAVGPSRSRGKPCKLFFFFLIWFAISLNEFLRKKINLDKTRSYNRGRRAQARGGCPYDMGHFFFLFLEQIAPSRAAHARTCCQNFCGCSAREKASKFPEIFDVFGPQLNTLMSLYYPWLKTGFDYDFKHCLRNTQFKVAQNSFQHIPRP